MARMMRPPPPPPQRLTVSDVLNKLQTHQHSRVSTETGCNNLSQQLLVVDLLSR